MLTYLSITNYAIIEQIELDFSSGFTVITGETGAGKSILLGAISLILGNRTDTSVLNNKDKKCVIEGAFLLEGKKHLPFFSDNELDFEEETIIRREINKTGKSRAFVNDTPVTLTVLKELTSKLIDVHSQHQTLNLQNNLFQTNVVDSYAHIVEKTIDYKNKYRSYKEQVKKLTVMQNSEANGKTDLEYLKFQIKELEELDLKENEKEEIQRQLDVINNTEIIKSTLEKASFLLDSSENNIISSLKDVVNSFAQIASFGDSYSQFNERINSLLIELEDVYSEIDMENNSFDFDPENAQYLTSRLSAIFGLEQKHSINNSNELLILLKNLKEQITSIDSLDEEIENLKLVIDKEAKIIYKLAKEISEKRKNIIPKLEKTIEAHLAELGMPDSSFIVKQNLLKEVTENGIDNIQFLFSANKGFKEKELEKTASGGELSRLMLSIKSILTSNSNISTIIFDEIDTGVSGDIADKMALIMKGMSDHTQIISITHLPQVAAKGNTHLKIYKETNGAKTSTYLKVLSKTDRVEEIAKMLSGKNTSAIAKENAKVLLES